MDIPGIELMSSTVSVASGKSHVRRSKGKMKHFRLTNKQTDIFSFVESSEYRIILCTIFLAIIW